MLVPLVGGVKTASVAKDAYRWSNRTERAVMKEKRTRVLMKEQPLPVSPTTLRKNLAKRHPKTKMTC